jgi:hypothetical protein
VTPEERETYRLYTWSTFVVMDMGDFSECFIHHCRKQLRNSTYELSYSFSKRVECDRERGVVD